MSTDPTSRTLERLSQWWLQADREHDPEARFRVEIGRALGGMLLVAMLLLGLTELRWGTPTIGAIFLFASLLMAAVVRWQRKHGATNVANSAMLGLAWLTGAVVNLGTGGVSVGANIVLPIFVMLAVMLSTPRMAWLWLLLVLAQLIAVAQLRGADVDFPLHPDPRWVASAIDRVPLIMSLTSALLGWLIRRALLGFRSRLKAAYEAERATRTRATQLAEQFAGFADIAADGFWETDAELRLSYVSPGFARMFKVEPQDLLGLTHVEAYRLRFPDAPYDRKHNQAIREHRAFSGQMWQLVDGQDRPRWLVSQGQPRFREDGTFDGFRGVVQEVTAQHLAKEKLRASEARLRLITDNLPALISYIDADGIFRFNNHAYSIWLDRPLSAITDQPLSAVFSAETFALIEPHLQRALAGERVDFDLAPSASRTRHAHVSYVPDVGPHGEVRGVCGLSQDVTQARHVEAELRRLAEFDLLTGLANRKRLGDKLTEAIARSERSGQLMALLFIDLDGFKSINDSLGHEGGDHVLQEVARRLQGCVRQTDTVARIAGDEFVIVLELLHNADEARLVASKVLHAMTAEFSIREQALLLSASIGITVRETGECDGDALLRRADAALYAAKAAGRGTFRVAAG